MKRIVLAFGALALAACGQSTRADDPGAVCQRDGDGATRIAACTAVIENAERSAEERAAAHAERAAAQQEAGDVTAALRDFEAALRLDENNAGALVGRARILLASGQLDAAEPLLRRAIAEHESGEANEMMGQIALRRGQYDDAIAYFDAALSKNARSAEAMAGRARTKQRMGDLGGASADYDQAVRFDGALADARAGRCWLDLNEQRDLVRARNDAEAAVAVDPRNVEAQLCRGVLQLRGGEWANARASFDAALAVEPGNPTALFGRGVARRRSGDNAGRQDMNRARDFDDRIGRSFDEMGVETY